MSGLKVLFLSQEEVVEAGGMDMDAMLDDVTLAFSLFDKGECLAPLKTALRWGDSDTEVITGRINCMPGYVGGKIAMAGLKWIGGSPSNPARFGIPRSSGLLILNDPITMAPIAIMDAGIISAMRTGAVSGAGARYLADPHSECLGLIGAGVQGRTQLMAMKAAIPGINDVKVYDLDPERAENFCTEMEKEVRTGKPRAVN